MPPLQCLYCQVTRSTINSIFKTRALLALDLQYSSRKSTELIHVVLLIQVMRPYGTKEWDSESLLSMSKTLNSLRSGRYDQLHGIPDARSFLRVNMFYLLEQLSIVELVQSQAWPVIGGWWGRGRLGQPSLSEVRQEGKLSRRLPWDCWCWESTCEAYRVRQINSDHFWLCPDQSGVQGENSYQ